jgi:hypothetical protein
VSSARPSADEPDTAAVAASLREARFVRVVSAASGDAVAASGLLARACRDASVPFQVRVRERPDPTPTDDELVVSVGVPGGDVAVTGAAPLSATAYDVASELGDDGSPVLGMAGVVAAGEAPGGDVLADAEAAGLVERRPGLAVPTADLADGLAHSLRLWTPYSGDLQAARATLADLELPADLGESARRRVASVAALDAATADGAVPSAAEAVGGALHPYETPAGPFATVGGYADVLDALARGEPGTGVALALGHDVREAALGAWRAHARAVHGALATATTGRYDGLFVARVDDGTPGELATAARLVRDYRSPEPVTLVVAEGAAAAVGDGADLAAVCDAAASALGGRGGGTTRRGTARYDDEVQSFITAFREEL